MNMKQNKNTVKHTPVQSYYEFLLERLQAKYARELVAGIIVVGLLLGGYATLTWYKKRQNVQAFAGLVEISKSYEKSLAAAKKQQESPASEQVENPWEDTQLLLEAIASKNSGP